MGRILEIVRQGLYRVASCTESMSTEEEWREKLRLRECVRLRTVEKDWEARTEAAHRKMVLEPTNLKHLKEYTKSLRRFDNARTMLVRKGGA